MVINVKDINNKNLGEIQFKTDDVKMTQNLSYNPQFWHKNQTYKMYRQIKAVKILKKPSKLKSKNANYRTITRDTRSSNTKPYLSRSPQTPL